MKPKYIITFLGIIVALIAFYLLYLHSSRNGMNVPPTIFSVSVENSKGIEPETSKNTTKLPETTSEQKADIVPVNTEQTSTHVAGSDAKPLSEEELMKIALAEMGKEVPEGAKFVVTYGRYADGRDMAIIRWPIPQKYPDRPNPPGPSNYRTVYIDKFTGVIIRVIAG